MVPLLCAGNTSTYWHFLSLDAEIRSDIKIRSLKHYMMILIMKLFWEGRNIMAEFLAAGEMWMVIF